MRSNIIWSDKIPERDGEKIPIWDLTFKPDGSQVVVAVGNRVLVYDAKDGDLLHSLKGHKDVVYCVEYSKDGKRFASGGADQTIFIWTSEAEGLLKYSHNDPIQKLAYNPVSQMLASCTESDFGLWSPTQKSVQKHKVTSKILCASWTNDGQFLALGMLNGRISIRDKNGAEQVFIQRDAPIWSMSWNPSRDEPFDVLAVGCWDQTLSFYQLNGSQHGRDRHLDFDPCSVSYYGNGEYLIVAGSDRSVSLYTKEGVKLQTVAEKSDWVWVAKARPKSHHIALGCNNGNIDMCQLSFSTVHGLYKDRYAFRDQMTDVIVQHLMTDQRVRIRCRDYVKKIAVYCDLLAVQFPERITIYELTHEDLYDMHYKVKRKINQKLDCNLLVVTSLHVILCQERKLQLYDFNGEKEREWVLDSVIRYIKVVGGPKGQEGLLVGLKNGQVLKIFVDNPFPIPLIKENSAIRCLDLSASRNKLAVVDENQNCLVYDLRSKELLFREPGANSVAWNKEFEDMLCFSGNGLLSIKTGDFPAHQQKLQGFVVGFQGSKIFCLQYVTMQTVDVPQSASMYRYLDKESWDKAFAVAALGVTENDWRTLALRALRSMKLDIARKAFIRIRDVKYIDLIDRVETSRKAGTGSDSVYLAEIMAYGGRYQEAAKRYAQAGMVDKAIEMFTDMRLWEEARKFVESMKESGSSGVVDVRDLMLKQAQWLEQTGDFKAAASIYATCEMHEKAVQLYGEHGHFTELINAARSLDKSDKPALLAAATYLKHGGQRQLAREIYVKLGDVEHQLKLAIEAQEWEEAFRIADQHKGSFSNELFLPYAEYLITKDRFEEAQAAYRRAGRPDLAVSIIQELTHNAVVESRFYDAGRFFFAMAMDMLRRPEDINPLNASTTDAASENAGRELTPDQLQRFHSYIVNARLYTAYAPIYEYIESPFTSMTPLNLFHAATFILNALSGMDTVPYRISVVYVLYTLARQAISLKAYKVARIAYDRLQSLRLPQQWRDAVDRETLIIQSKPYNDSEDLLPACYRCTTTNPALVSGPVGDVCVNCGHPFVRSFLTFEVLPVVQFVPADDITYDEAIELLKEDGRSRQIQGDGWQERDANGAQTLSFGGNEGKESEDPFSELLANWETVTNDGSPMPVSRDVLRSIPGNEVLVVQFPSPSVPVVFYKNMMPEIGIVSCEHTKHLYHEVDYELTVLEKRMPFVKSIPHTSSQ